MFAFNNFKKIIFRILMGIIGLLMLVTVLLIVTDNSYVFNAVTKTYLKGHKTANIDDYVDFDNRTIQASKHIAWEKHEKFDEFKLTKTLQQALDTDETVAFAVIQDGKLLYENYWQGYSSDSHTNSFSMAKSITTMLYLKAVEDGYITSKDEPIITLLPEYANNEYAQSCTLADLSGMTSGYDWDENYYLPINPTAKAYYGNNLEEQMVKRDFIKPCGGSFKYSSGDTQLLGIALSRALAKHDLTISSYLEQSFWQPLGMKNDGFWSLDGSAKIEKTYCCVNANLLDFAKFGQLLSNGGEWQGTQLLSQEHVDFMVTPNNQGITEGGHVIYGHSIWTDMDSPIPFYAMLGHLGQRVIVVPDYNLIIVRLGKQKGYRANQTEGFLLDTDLGFYISEVLKNL